MPTHGTFDTESSLAKGIILTKFGLANSAILKLWVAHPYPKFSWEPPPPPTPSCVFDLAVIPFVLLLSKCICEAF